jgi:Leucine-rich repeat (LRR) protein
MYDDWLYAKSLKAIEGDGFVLYVDDKGKALRAICSGDDMALREVCKHTSLAKLLLEASDVTDDGFPAIAELKELRILDMGSNNPHVTGSSLYVLPKLRKLEVLVGDPKLNREVAFEHIGNCDSLVRLQLSSLHGFPGKSLQHLTKLKNLRDLTISNNPVTDEDLVFVQKLPSLRKFSCECEKLTNRSLDILSVCRQLEELNVSESGVSDEGLESLRPLKQLRKLMIAGTKVRGHGLAALAELPALEDLTISSLPIDDSHVDLLLRCKNVKSIDICDTKITKAGAKKLLDNLPLKMLHMDEDIRAQLRREGIVDD